MLKLARKVRGHFVTLIEIRVHLIRVKPGHISNEEVLSRAGSRSLFQTLKIRRMRWLGHFRRMPDGRLPKDILYSKLCTGSRPRGRPMLRFKDVAKRDLVALDIDNERWEELAEDRTGWRNALRKGGEELEARWLEKLAIQRLAL